MAPLPSRRLKTDQPGRFLFFADVAGFSELIGSWLVILMSLDTLPPAAIAVDGAP